MVNKSRSMNKNKQTTTTYLFFPWNIITSYTFINWIVLGIHLNNYCYHGYNLGHKQCLDSLKNAGLIIDQGAHVILEIFSQRLQLNKNANIDSKGFNSPTISLPSFLDRVHHPHDPIPKTYLKGHSPKNINFAKKKLMQHV